MYLRYVKVNSDFVSLSGYLGLKKWYFGLQKPYKNKKKTKIEAKKINDEISPDIEKNFT